MMFLGPPSAQCEHWAPPPQGEARARFPLRGKWPKADRGSEKLYRSFFQPKPGATRAISGSSASPKTQISFRQG